MGKYVYPPSIVKKQTGVRFGTWFKWYTRISKNDPITEMYFQVGRKGSAKYRILVARLHDAWHAIIKIKSPPTEARTHRAKSQRKVFRPEQRHKKQKSLDPSGHGWPSIRIVTITASKHLNQRRESEIMVSS